MTEPSDALRARFAAAVGGPLALSRSDDRWVALGAEVVGFAADDDAIWRRLEREAWLPQGPALPGRAASRSDAEVNRPVEARRGARAPRAPRRRRAPDPGPRAPARRGRAREVETRLFGGPPPAARTRLAGAPLSPFGERLATSYGELATRIRRAVAVEDAHAAGSGFTSRRSLDLDRVIALLRTAGAPVATVAAAERARPWIAALPPPDAVIHSDLHFFNMCLDEAGAIPACSTPATRASTRPPPSCCTCTRSARGSSRA